MTGTKSFREQRKAIIKDPARRANVQRQKALMLGAARLFELRKERGLSQADLAERLGVTQKRISAIERAEDLNLSTLERYVAALGGRLHAGIEFDDETVALTPDDRPRDKGRRQRVPA
jgi:transcriptional regulator with XRE-family HTH domain